ncbi:MAG: DUF4173 domain-containing protein [Actinomycetota bacterium]
MTDAQFGRAPEPAFEYSGALPPPLPPPLPPQAPPPEGPPMSDWTPLGSPMSDWTPPPPPPSRRRSDRKPWPERRPLPRWDVVTLSALLGGAILLDVAVRLPPATVASALLLFLAVALITHHGGLPTLTERLGALGAVALAVLLVIRDSPWVVGPVLVAGGGLLILLATDGLRQDRSWPWLRAGGDSLNAVVDALPWLWTGATKVGAAQRPGRVVLLLRMAAVAAAVIAVLGALLASGDAAFRWLLLVLTPASGAGHLFTVLVLVPTLTPFALLAARRSMPAPTDTDADTDSEDGDEAEADADIGIDPHAATTPDRTSNPDAVDTEDEFGADTTERPRFRVEALTALWAAAAVLVVWCGLQLAVIAGGAQSFLAEQDITAAEYARQGFFQLVAVATLSLTVLNGVHRLTVVDGRPNAAQRLPALIVTAALVVLIGVSYSRLGYYIDSFGLTMLRLSVATFLGWLALMTASSLARSLGSGAHSNWLPTFAVLSATVVTIGFGAVNPEAVVAQVNLDRADIGDPVDDRYLTRQLGADARRAVADYDWERLGGMPEPVRQWLCDDVGTDDFGPLGWNWSRATAPDLTCPVEG